MKRGVHDSALPGRVTSQVQQSADIGAIAGSASGNAAGAPSRQMAVPKAGRLTLWLRQAALLRYAIEDWGERLWRVRLHGIQVHHIRWFQAVRLSPPQQGCLKLRHAAGPVSQCHIQPTIQMIFCLSGALVPDGRTGAWSWAWRPCWLRPLHIETLFRLSASASWRSEWQPRRAHAHCCGASWYAAYALVHLQSNIGI